mmetsp:Transcript_20877/g.34413  ORF Transcript_20877/g.34413 Transcript_20877/m.34413 type:complete len:521 (-) Transcript_20877:292-1854(-)|eukprot:CAMPEP_0184334466 /NCGR_PEP_ID=MMETSP1089-20130417/3243_1 /TAXON_ID=38269 ORGANISM="Gloeochaete wittrockiana, Strain SAG46.84" /NCGR_SAMPLE_ID=MMETSP1089 /ASSEMBLY_ACC=CAM_ASM_000445 /LENGTH=520 /DNA_ID=CAMNT_0026658731 /DNA_START=53 /DNA_END=1615 /DNA_ORIENTATION=+
MPISLADTPTIAKTFVSARDSKVIPISILGCRKSGKSTFVDALFGTRFAQSLPKNVDIATPGVLLDPSETEGLCSAEVKIAVLDVPQANDSSASTSDGRPALFFLAVSEVVFLNMWFHDVGRYRAASYDLLSHVFQAYLRLIGYPLQSSSASSTPDSECVGPGCVTKLVVLLRDAEAEPTLNVLSASMLKDMEGIWTNLRKPEHVAHLAFSDVFTVEFVALPHYRYERLMFDECVATLRDRLVEQAQGPNGFLSRSTKAVPAPDFPTYLSSMWAAVDSDQDIILSQRELLASYKCNEAVALLVALNESTHMERIMSEAALLPPDSSLQSFGSKVSAAVTDITGRYDEAAGWARQVPVFACKREELISRVSASYHTPLLQQLARIRSVAATRFRALIEKYANALALEDSRHECVEQITKQYTDHVEGMLAQLPGGHDWRRFLPREYEALQAELADSVDRRKDELMEVRVLSSKPPPGFDPFQSEPTDKTHPLRFSLFVPVLFFVMYSVLFNTNGHLKWLSR